MNLTTKSYRNVHFIPTRLYSLICYIMMLNS